MGPRSRDNAALLLLPVFFASGLAALVYQMVWQRVLTFFSGADVYSVTLIVAAFMAGLGFGSLAGGVLADRLSLARRFRAFALAELGVAAFACVSMPLYYNALFRGLGERDLSPVIVGAILFLTLLVPTFLMGLSLPLLASTIGPTGKPPEDWVGQLYGANTLGAALGSLLAVWWLVRSLGFTGSVYLAASLNVACALVALALARRHARDVVQAAPATVLAASPVSFSFPVWATLFALSGFVALSLEIVWFRLLGVILKSNAFTFATLLAVYLLGIGGGAFWGSRLARRAQHPTVVFLTLQAIVPVYAALALAAFVYGIPAGWGPSLLRDYLTRYETLDLARTLQSLAHLRAGLALDEQGSELVRMFGWLYVAVPLFLFGPPTALMGLSFPFLQKATQTDPAVLGRRVGLLQAANILGCTLGATLTGLGLLTWLGSAGTLRLLVGLAGVFALLLATPIVGRRGAALACGALVLAALVISPSASHLWAALHGAPVQDVSFDEDGSGLSVLKDRNVAGQIRTGVFASGLGQSYLPYGSHHTLLGAVPVLLHPRPSSVAIVGLGSGDTLFGAAARELTTRLDCIEIVAPQLRTLRGLDRTHDYPGLRQLLADSRVRHLTDDGRAFLMKSRERYDVIEADALRPTSAFSGSLYSREYFELLRARLRPGGFAVSWGPTERIQATFRRVFPYVLLVSQVLIGSEHPVEFDLRTLRARLADRFTRDHFGRARVDMDALLETFASGRIQGFTPEDQPADIDLNRDLFPRDEYLVPLATPR